MENSNLQSVPKTENMDNGFTTFSNLNGEAIIVRRSAILAVIHNVEKPKKFSLLLGKDFELPINEDLDLIQKKLID
jgi:hypothetical protein